MGHHQRQRNDADQWFLRTLVLMAMLGITVKNNPNAAYSPWIALGCLAGTGAFIALLFQHRLTPNFKPVGPLFGAIFSGGIGCLTGYILAMVLPIFH